MEVWSLVGKITLDGMAKVETQLSSLEGKLKKNEKGFENLRKAGMAFAGVATAIAGGSLKAAIDFETAFAGVRKTVEATEEQFAGLEDGIRSMSKELPVSANEIAGVAEAAGQLGIATEDILSFTEIMTKLGMATDLSADQAATSLARFANITGLAADEYSNLGAAVVGLGNNMAATESEIVDMAMRVAGAGTNAGLTQQEILALAGALTSMGLRAEAGGTAISQTLLTMNSAVLGGGEELEKFASVAGMSAENFAAAFRENASSALVTFIQGLGEMNDTGADTTGILGELGLGGIRITDTLLRASNAQDILTDALDIANTSWEENTALNDEVAKRNETAAAKMTMLKNSITDMAVNLGDALIPAITSLIEKIAPVIEKVSNWIKENEGLAKTILAIAGGGGALLLLVGLIPKIVGMFTGFINAIKLFSNVTKIATAVQWLWNAAMTANPIGLIIVAIAALIAAIVLIAKNWETIREKTVEIWNNIVGFLKGVWDGIVGFFKDIWDNVTGIFSNAWEFIKSVWNNVADFFGSIPEKIGQAFSTIKDIILSPFRAVWKGIESGINWVIDMLNKISFDIPDWVPLLGGKHFGINISHVSLPSFQGWEGRIPGAEGQPYLAEVHGGEYIYQTPKQSGPVNLNIEVAQMVVREEADIKRVAKELYSLVSIEQRGLGIG